LPDSYDESVQSLQLEIKKAGCRDNAENVTRIASALGDAFLQLIDEEQDMPAEPAELEIFEYHRKVSVEPSPEFKKNYTPSIV